MTITVTPDRFTLVEFDADEIAALASRLGRRIGVPDGTAVTFEVDETTPLGRSQIVSTVPAVLAVESGALEDPKRPRQLSLVATTDVLGRLLFRLHDTLDPAFGRPQGDAELPVALATAWNTYAAGRLSRLDVDHRPPGSQRQRYAYHFRVRHGFTDRADNAFDTLWEANELTWDEIGAFSAGATAQPLVR